MAVEHGYFQTSFHWWIKALTCIVGAILVAYWSIAALGAGQKDAFNYNRLIGRGINLGNALSAPNEGAWGITLREDYFQAIKDAGFDSVRIPIRWSAHTGVEPPFLIDPTFFSRVDWAIEQSLSRGLVTIINVQDFDEMDAAPEENLSRLLAIWQQIALRYRASSDRLYFELLNEPHGKLNEERWREIVPALLQSVRKENPQRMVVIGPVFWNSLDFLDRLSLPENDSNLIVTFHYYQPMPFTHQGTSWVSGSEAWKGTTWTGTAQQRAALSYDFSKVKAWAKENRRPIYLGEFGSYEAADMESRVLWTKAVVAEAQKNGFSWAYWQFGTNFAAYDLASMAWHESLLRALMTTR